jgi:hypothetical protein
VTQRESLCLLESVLSAAHLVAGLLVLPQLLPLLLSLLVLPVQPRRCASRAILRRQMQRASDASLSNSSSSNRRLKQADTA